VDGGGEIVGEGGVAEAVGAEGDFSGAIEDDNGGEGVDAEEGVEAIGEDGGGAGFKFVEIGCDEGFIVVAIGGEEENAFIAGEFGGDFFVERFEGVAGAAPSGPEIYNYNFSFLCGERELGASGSFAEHVVEGFLGGGVAPGLWRGGGSGNIVEGSEQEIAEANVRTVGKAPDVA